jgi:hypothetical protein
LPRICDFPSISCRVGSTVTALSGSSPPSGQESDQLCLQKLAAVLILPEIRQEVVELQGVAMS